MILTEQYWLMKPLFTGVFFSLGIILFFQLLVRLVLNHTTRHTQNVSKVDFSVGRLKLLSVIYFSVLAILFEYKSAMVHNYAGFMNFRLLLLIFIVVFLGFHSSFEIVLIDILAHLVFYRSTVLTLYHAAFLIVLLLILEFSIFLIRKRESQPVWIIPATQGLTTIMWIVMHYYDIVGIGRVTVREMWFNIVSFLIMETVLYFGLSILFAYNQQLISVALQATTDALTKLKNYNMFHKEFPVIFDRAKQTDVDFTMIEMDIDRFKSINDTYGHLAGNDVLTVVGATLKSITDEMEHAKCYRTGGEEFSLLMAGKNVEEAQVVAQDLAERIAALEVNYHGQMITFTASIGIAKLRESDGCSNDLFERADRMLYLSKGRGCNLITTDETN